MKARANKSNLASHLGALIAVTAWGASFISTKVLLQDGVGAVDVYIYRFLIAYICTFAICPKPFFAHSVKDELKFILCGVCGGSVYFIAENTAVVYTLVSNVSLIVAMAPLITAILVAALYKSERVSRGVIIGSLVSLTGVGCVIFNSSVVVQVNPLGDMLALLAALCWAIYSILLRSLGGVYGAWFMTRKTFFYGVITALPFLPFERSHASWAVLTSTEVLGNIAFLGLFCSMIAYLLWGMAVKNLGAVKSGNYLYFSPIVTLILSSWLLGEAVSVVGVIGCILILGGVVVGDRMGSRRHEPAKTM